MDSRASNTVWVMLGFTPDRQHCSDCGKELFSGDSVGLSIIIERAPVIDAPTLELVCKVCAGASPEAEPPST